jgi:hypothetical protein
MENEALETRITEMEDLILRTLHSRQESPEKQRQLNLLTAIRSENKFQRVEFLEALLRDEINFQSNQGQVK